jgi:transcription initiation factor TFIIIB Brf1 subunit/transcription initiation factor TFIIB
MHCPKCNSKHGIEIDMHSDGYAKDLLECTACGTVWLEKLNEIIFQSQQASESGKGAPAGAPPHSYRPDIPQNRYPAGPPFIAADPD